MRFQSNFLDQHKDFTLPLKAVCWFKNDGKQLLIIDSIVGDSQMYSHKENTSTVFTHDVNDLKKMRVHKRINYVRDAVALGLYGTDIILVGGGIAMIAFNNDKNTPGANLVGTGVLFVLTGIVTTGITMAYVAITRNTYQTKNVSIQGFKR